MQLSLIGPPPAGRTETSREAAQAQGGGKRETDREAILRTLERRGSYGATDDELQEELDMLGNTERPRRKELQQAGVIAVQRVAGDPVTRRTRTGSRAQVWVLKQYLTQDTGEGGEHGTSPGRGEPEGDGQSGESRADGHDTPRNAYAGGNPRGTVSQGP